MAYDIGENLVGSYLTAVEQCEFVIFNTHLPAVQGEIDVLGLKLAGERREVICCEVATHLQGLEYGAGYTASAQKVAEKIQRARRFAATTFPDDVHRFKFWCPRIPVGALTDRLAALQTAWEGEGLQVTLVANEEYARRLQALIDVARSSTKATSDVAFRLLRILTHVRGPLRLSEAPPGR